MRRSKLVLALLSLVAGLCAAEVGLRMFLPIEFLAPVPALDGDAWRGLVHRRATIPGLAYELNPGAHAEVKGAHVVVDGFGMRAPDVAVPRAARAFRVTAVGDSVTFGWGVSCEETWPFQLRRALAENATLLAGREAEVLNLGVSGYSSRDEALVVEHKALALDPDLVVVGYVLNDPECWPLAPLQRAFHDRAWWEHSHLMRLVAKWTYQHEVQRYGGGDFFRYLHALDGPCWSDVPRSFAAIRRTTDARGVRVLVAIFPAFGPFETWSAYPWRDLHAQVAQAARAAGLDVIDLLSVFEAQTLPPHELSVDIEHPNGAGDALAAAAIAAEIARMHFEPAVKR